MHQKWMVKGALRENHCQSSSLSAKTGDQQKLVLSLVAQQGQGSARQTPRPSNEFDEIGGPVLITRLGPGLLTRSQSGITQNQTPVPCCGSSWPSSGPDGTACALRAPVTGVQPARARGGRAVTVNFQVKPRSEQSGMLPGSGGINRGPE